ncbi:MAG: alpha-ketoacid dehydrogenase subunit beta [Firmicutes bacterium]|nr:alpha-ketoacid dehydrogenase subunit beta [Bacillota bacterium]
MAVAKVTTAVTMVQALNLALRQEMEKDPSVMILGEDVGKNGGVFRVTDGLYDIFGEERVISTPLAETAVAGAAIGLAINGMKPVAEIQFEGFMPPAFDQMFSHAAKMRNRSRGRFTVPMVLRAPYGGGVRALEHHSESPEAYFIHTPGLKVVIPSSPQEAKGLLISAIRDPDPVVFLEPKRLYRAFKEEVPEDEYTIPLGKANVVKEGKEITVLAWGAMLKVSLEAANRLKDTISVEVIDLRTLAPVDEEAIVKSVKKTGRAVIVHEAPKNCGFGAELSSIIMEKAFLSLKAPVKRVAGWDTPIPLPKYEDYYYPNVDRIMKELQRTVAF